MFGVAEGVILFILEIAEVVLAALAVWLLWRGLKWRRRERERVRTRELVGCPVGDCPYSKPCPRHGAVSVTLVDVGDSE